MFARTMMKKENVRSELENGLVPANGGTSSDSSNKRRRIDDHVRIEAELNEHVPRAKVLARRGPGGSSLSYIPGYYAFETARRIFGHDGWSSSIISKEMLFLDETSPGRWSACCEAIVEVRLATGATHQDVGCGTCENVRSKADAAQKVLKEAITDARKRALRLFGSALGANLYAPNFGAESRSIQRPSASVPHASRNVAATPVPPRQRSSALKQEPTHLSPGAPPQSNAGSPAAPPHQSAADLSAPLTAEEWAVYDEEVWM
ncbi:DNA repair and recombination protein rad22 [Porphyridium purpureum]|uniref:DNA repair and recombination protein rad22 n=1 Tax=Porphyridium purpureum TaxID=35688 RepID=A0A5J4Z657_PORPP|nr:DNA repair and recombination protein rad22 [Porphyridium purpureum]|eukprot:POR1709..scf295_1